MFPIEIYEKILDKVDDASDLITFKHVNRDWSYIIDKFLRKFNNTWQTLCQRDIPEKDCLIYSIMEIANPNYSYDVHPNYWRVDPELGKRIYCSWINWPLCVEREQSIEIINWPLVSADERVTCIAVKDNILGIGTDGGFIYFYHTDDPDYYFLKINNGQCITQIELWYIEHWMICASTSFNDELRFWNIITGREIISSVTAATLVCTGWGRCFSEYKGSLTQHQPEFKKSDRIKATRVPSLDLKERDTVVAMRSENNSLLVMIFDGITTKLLVFEFFVFYEIGVNRRIPVVNELVSNIKRFDILSSTVCVGISDKTLAFSVYNKDWDKYPHSEFFDSAAVTSAIFHANLIILGSSTGKIELRRVKKIPDMSDLNSQTVKSKILNIDKEPIVLLKITETKGDQVIIAGTERKIYIIEFSSFS